ncbi:MAG TPA: PAS domain S-box protein [Terriglobales bacterium]|nr:PAS domain S-box protein [Terriglobales bacterium]
MAHPPSPSNADLYKDLVEHSQDLLCTHDLEGRLLSVNPAPARILGYEVEELLKIPMRELLAPEVRDQFEVYLDRVKKTGTAEGMLVLMTRTGERRFWEYRNTLRTEGLPTPIVRGMAHDVTERKRAEALLRHEREFLEAVLENMAEGIVACDAEGRITRFNRASSEILGGAVHPFPPEKWAQEYGIYLEDEKTPAKLEQIPLYRALHGERFRDLEVKLVPKNGDTRSVLVSGRPLTGARGQKLGAMIAMHDITERKRLQEQVSQSQRLEAIGVLAGGLAHDFNNLLGVILGYAEMMQRDLPESSPSARHAAGVRRAAEAAAALTRQLLAFSRKQLMQAKVVDLNDLVAHFAKMLQPVISHNIDLAMELAPDLRSVKVDPLQIEQVLMNLALNARDAMPGGGQLLISTANVESYQINLPRVNAGTYVMVSVADTGLGMEEEIASRIFEPFFTTKGCGKGTGLGLSIIYGIVKQSGGYITVESKVGKGSKFSIYFPTMVETIEVEQPQRPGKGVPLSNKPATVLVVEDEPGLSEMLCEVLESESYRVLLAASPEDALEIARTHDNIIDLLITDVDLRSDLDGTELAEKFRSLRPSSKIMLMSGYSDVLLAGNYCTSSSVLEKPFSAEQLLHAVRGHLTSA